jgi:gluconokinase
MGASGSGKTTVGTLLAHELNWQFAEGDDYHSAANVEKMRSGIPLTDADRAPWLDALRSLITSWIAKKENGVLACSALRRVYREKLRGDDDAVKFVYLKANYELLAERLTERRGHYMKRQMLESQLATLEEPENAVTVDASRTLDEIVREIRKNLRLE